MLLRYLHLSVLLLLLIDMGCRRHTKVVPAKSYEELFAWKGIDKPQNSYEDLSIRFCNPYMDKGKFKSPMVDLELKKSYKVKLKFKFQCAPTQFYYATNNKLKYTISFIDSCGKLRCIQPSSNDCQTSPSSYSSSSGRSSDDEEARYDYAAAYSYYYRSSGTTNATDQKAKNLADLQKCVVEHYRSGSDCISIGINSNNSADSIEFKVTSGYPMFLSVSGYGPRNSGVEASITAVSEDGYIDIPPIQTKQIQNNDGYSQLQDPLCQYIILP